MEQFPYVRLRLQRGYLKFLVPQMHELRPQACGIYFHQATHLLPAAPHVARVPLVYLAHHRVRGLLIGADSERLVVQVFCPRGRHEKRLKRAFDPKIWAPNWRSFTDHRNEGAACEHCKTQPPCEHCGRAIFDRRPQRGLPSCAARGGTLHLPHSR